MGREDAEIRRREKLDQAIRVVADFIRNVHLKRVLHTVDSKPRLNFWRQIYGNLLDMAIIEWCKLFGSDHYEHQPVHWKNIIHKGSYGVFRQELVARLNISVDQWKQYHASIIYYRNTYAAHFSPPWFLPDMADQPKRADIPDLEIALEAAYFYYDKLLGLYETDPHHYPVDIREYCERFRKAAHEAAIKASDATAGMIEKVW